MVLLVQVVVLESFLYKTAQTLTLGGSGYTVTVGAGGIGGQVTNSTVGSAGAQGGDSVFIQTTKGGGFGRPAGGSPAGVYVGSDGGSGGGGTFNGAGGASIATSPGLGFAGGAGFFYNKLRLWWRWGVQALQE